MKNIEIDGRIASEFEARQTKNGATYYTFVVAVSTFKNGEKGTEWFNLTTFDSTIPTKFSKGDFVLVHGKNFEASYNVDPKTGKVYLNQNATVSQIDLIFAKKKSENENVAPTIQTTLPPRPSATTGTSISSLSSSKPVVEVEIPAVKPQPVYAGVSIANADDNDLPF